jgi:hypothetical protein
MHMSPIQWLMLLSAPVLQALLLGTLIKRKVRSSVPVFFNYVVFGIVVVTLQIAMFPRISPAQYFYLYWTIEALGAILAFAVIYEVFVNILKPYTALIDFSKMLFWWAAGFLLLASVLTVLASSATDTTTKICAAVALFQKVVQLMQCGLLLLLLSFESRLGLSWRSHGMSIALGMGVYSALNLGVSFMRDHFPAWQPKMNIANTVLCLGIIAMWQINFMLPEPQRKNVQDSPRRLIFQRWNEALAGVSSGDIAFSSADSFIPGVEKAVERVLARKMVQ